MLNYLILLFGVFVTSWSSIFIRWIGDVHPLVISFYRLFFSVLVLSPFLLKRMKSGRHLPSNVFSKNTLFLILSGFFLAMHFFTWIQSLQWTTVGNSIFLESTHPIFAVILSYFVLKEKSSPLIIGGIALALLGIFVIVNSDMGAHPFATLGDFLAIISAFCLAAYLLIARFYRQKIDLLPYLVLVYAAAALFTLLLILFLKINFLNLALKSWFFLGLLALGPNLIGHSLLNWASRKMPVYLVNLAMQGEAVLATFYAALLLNEIPGEQFYFGAGLILLAVSFIFLNRR
ncbi:protein of unknown function DUF6 transmembrane [Caldithrix abyssi DSM 13497]|uniref:Threonine/homoserine efflux transporter RhtA n=1 Tax=Caldithrix abyssi DSM 13497 TaxID=880073 RepID=H1XP70_CALAY|nr:DMT family transporter [Caldithrix abyssi]APF18154.1 Threonine/homoserine efflux transporter RhtA [Caldithrix abyssi DSM 13497]EHO42185.1 protein of unknown function DUF6 transmembrane [Caldithrix abyssi DSM 13497]